MKNLELPAISTSIFRNVYRLFSRFVSCDLSTIYVLDCDALAVSPAKEPRPAENIDLHFASVSAQELLEAGGEELDFSVEDARGIGGSARCLAAYKGEH